MYSNVRNRATCNYKQDIIFILYRHPLVKPAASWKTVEFGKIMYNLYIIYKYIPHGGILEDLSRQVLIYTGLGRHFISRADKKWCTDLDRTTSRLTAWRQSGADKSHRSPCCRPVSDVSDVTDVVLSVAVCLSGCRVSSRFHHDRLRIVIVAKSSRVSRAVVAVALCEMVVVKSALPPATPPATPPPPPQRIPRRLPHPSRPVTSLGSDPRDPRRAGPHRGSRSKNRAASAKPIPPPSPLRSPPPLRGPHSTRRPY